MNRFVVAALEWAFGPSVEVPEAVHLDLAVLCEECRCITAACNGHCPICGSAALLNLASVLERSR